MSDLQIMTLVLGVGYTLIGCMALGFLVTLEDTAKEAKEKIWTIAFFSLIWPITMCIFLGALCSPKKGKTGEKKKKDE